VEIGEEGVRAPIDVAAARSRFRLVREYRFGDDNWYEFERRAA
jgi:diaminohydroxyphosphoribosylaminopyrimidine deaminase/5-amino-6-(5-phosphoribosylamino)uracil reductase